MISRGVILAGGRGTRLLPATRVTNKHLLPIYDRPMILWPLQTLRQLGATEVLVITGTEHAGDFARLLGTGAEYGLRLTFRVQSGAGGIAEALSLAEDFAREGNIAATLGDNIFQADFANLAHDFGGGAQIFLKQVPDPHRFGIAQVDQHGMVQHLEEKPAKPRSSFAVTGMYFFDSQVFAHLRRTAPSARGEREIITALEAYRAAGQLRATQLSGAWLDAGTHESLHQASATVRAFLGQSPNNNNVQQEEAEIKAKPSVAIAVCVASWHSSKAVETALESAHRQIFNGTTEILLVGPDWAQPLAKRFGAHFLCSKENPGIPAMANQALHFEYKKNANTKSPPDYFLLLSPGADVPDPGFASKLQSAMWDHRVAACAGKIFRQQNGKKTEILESAGLARGWGMSFFGRGVATAGADRFDEAAAPLGVPMGVGLWRRSALVSVGGFSEDFQRFHADADACLALRDAGFRVAFVPSARAWYAEDSSGPRGFWGHLRNFFTRSAAVSATGLADQRALLKKRLHGFPLSTRLAARLRLLLQRLGVGCVRLFSG